MKLLLDQNLSPRLIDRLNDLYPDAIHVSQIGLDQASDEVVWDYAHANDCIIVTKDADFGDISLLRGTPPKVLWLRLGNCTTAEVEESLRMHYSSIQAFSIDQILSVLTIL